MKKVVLKNTTNSNFQELIGKEGYLSEEYDRFIFEYFENGKLKCIQSSNISSAFAFNKKEEGKKGFISFSCVETIYGGIKNLTRGIVSYKTRNSSYEFETV